MDSITAYVMAELRLPYQRQWGHNRRRAEYPEPQAVINILGRLDRMAGGRSALRRFLWITTLFLP